jgi:shikimate dehydrogenase
MAVTLDITGKTRVFGVIADPIGHVRAPMVFNPYFEKHGIDAVMVPLHAPAGELDTFLAGLKAMHNFGGMAVTIPHKLAIMQASDEVGTQGRLIGAVNCVRFDDDRRMCSDMFDGLGFVAGLRGEGFEVTGRAVLLVGAGGGGRAIAYALGEAGVARLAIANRTHAKAEELASAVQAAYPAVDVSAATADPGGYDVVINATSLGLKEGDRLPIDIDRVEARQLIADIIMIPVETALLKAAKAKGCPVHYGRHMLDYQMHLMAKFMRCAAP